MVESLKKLNQDRKKCDRDRKSFKSVTNTLKSDTTHKKVVSDREKSSREKSLQKLTFFHSTPLNILKIADYTFC